MTMTKSRLTSTLTTVLRGLSERAATEAKADFTPAVEIVSDLGCLAANGTAVQIRAIQAEVAAVRERLQYSHDVVQRPLDALRGKNSHVFLSGAMWAMNEAMQERLTFLDEREHAGAQTSRRAQVRQLVEDALNRQGALSPRFVIDGERAVAMAVRSDEVSRALSDLMEAGHVQPGAAPEGADRRRRFFALVSDDSPTRRTKRS